MRRDTRRIRFKPAVAAALLLGALASAAVLVVAEFLTLYAVRVIRGSASVPPVSAGSENHYALIPIALLALVMVVVAVRVGDRWALAAVAALGLIALLIGLLHDLPDARRTGLVGSLHSGWVRGASSPSTGMYLETLGAVMLLLTAGLGLLFGEQVVEDAPATAEEAARVPFGVEPAGEASDTGPTASTGDVAAAVVEAPVVEEAPVLEEAPVVEEAPAVDLAPTVKATPKRTRATATTPRKKSPSNQRKRPAKRQPAGARNRPASARNGDASGSGEGPTAEGSSSTPAKRAPAKRSSGSSAKRSPSGARKPATKRPPGTPKKGGSPTRGASSTPKRSES